MTSLMDDGNENTIDDHMRDENRKGARSMNDEHMSDMPHRNPSANPNQRKNEPMPGQHPGQPSKDRDKEVPGEDRDQARPGRKDNKRDANKRK